MLKPGMMAAIALAAGMTEEEAKTVVIDAAFIKKHLPAVAGVLALEGAKAEQARLAGIETFAGLGHDKLVAEHKADPSKTALDTGLAFAAAQRATLSTQVENLKVDETKVSGLKSETANPKPPEAKTPAGLEGEPKWKAEWDGSAALQREFASQSDYVAIMKAERDGMVKRLKNHAA